MEIVNRSCEFNLQDLEDAVRDTRFSFVINNKRVWMNQKPEFFEKMDQKLRRENYIPDNTKSVVSVFLTNGEVWPVDFEIKQRQFETTILIPTHELKDLGGGTILNGMRSYVMYPGKAIYNFGVNGSMIMFDYVREDWVKQREQEKLVRFEEQQAAMEALTIS